MAHWHQGKTLVCHGGKGGWGCLESHAWSRTKGSANAVCADMIFAYVSNIHYASLKRQYILTGNFVKYRNRGLVDGLAGGVLPL